jgi:hypothetical protein
MHLDQGQYGMYSMQWLPYCFSPHHDHPIQTSPMHTPYSCPISYQTKPTAQNTFRPILQRPFALLVLLAVPKRDLQNSQSASRHLSQFHINLAAMIMLSHPVRTVDRRVRRSQKQKAKTDTRNSEKATQATYLNTSFVVPYCRHFPRPPWGSWQVQ